MRVGAKTLARRVHFYHSGKTGRWFTAFV